MDEYPFEYLSHTTGNRVLFFYMQLAQFKFQFSHKPTDKVFPPENSRLCGK